MKANIDGSSLSMKSLWRLVWAMRHQSFHQFFCFWCSILKKLRKISNTSDYFSSISIYLRRFHTIHLASICVDNQYCIKVGWLHPSPLRLPALNRRTSKESSCSPNYIKVNILMYTYSNEGQRYVGARQLYLFHRDGTDSMFSPSCLSPYR